MWMWNVLHHSEVWVQTDDKNVMIKRQECGQNWMRRDLLNCTVPRTFLWGLNEGWIDGRTGGICGDMGNA